MKLEFDTYYELLALHKSIMAVKFDRNKCLPEAIGSPLLAKQAFRVVSLIVEHFQATGNEKETATWLEWQKADLNRIESKYIVDFISESEWWANLSEEGKRGAIENFMAPLILNENDVAVLLAEY